MSKGKVMGKLTDTEFESIKNAIQVEHKISQRLGSLEYQLIQLKNSKQTIIANMDKLLQDRQSIIDELRRKYSIETLNIDTGEFTVTK
tara:strand:- start:1264 stop:1527 length:264 start_codon:yes stop_codon:yes gene_type:complete